MKPYKEKNCILGIVKITPAHDQFERVLIVIIVKGMPRFIARKKILDYLSNTGNLVSIKNHAMQIPRCSRTGDVIELLLKEQWFLNCKYMLQKAYEALESGSLKLDPSIHNQTWFNWLSSTSSRWYLGKILVSNIFTL